MLRIFEGSRWSFRDLDEFDGCLKETISWPDLRPRFGPFGTVGFLAVTFGGFKKLCSEYYFLFTFLVEGSTEESDFLPRFKTPVSAGRRVPLQDTSFTTLFLILRTLFATSSFRGPLALLIARVDVLFLGDWIVPDDWYLRRCCGPENFGGFPIFLDRSSGGVGLSKGMSKDSGIS